MNLRISLIRFSVMGTFPYLCWVRSIKVWGKSSVYKFNKLCINSLKLVGRFFCSSKNCLRSSVDMDGLRGRMTMLRTLERIALRRVRSLRERISLMKVKNRSSDVILLMYRRISLFCDEDTDFSCLKRVKVLLQILSICLCLLSGNREKYRSATLLIKSFAVEKLSPILLLKSSCSSICAF